MSRSLVETNNIEEVYSRFKNVTNRVTEQVLATRGRSKSEAYHRKSKRPVHKDVRLKELY